MWLCSA
jgi:hypothetical protein